MYNVLEKLRSGEALTDKDQKIHHAGLVSVLKQIHDDLDAAVFAAYGWPATLSDEEILQRLVALNAERAAEEARGVVRWLRPEFQCRPLTPSGPEAGTTPNVDEGRRGGKRGGGAGPSRRERTTLLEPTGESDLEALAPTKKRRKAGGSLRSTPATHSDGELERSAGRSGPERPTLAGKLPWPKERAERTKAVQDALAAVGAPVSSAELAKRFVRGNKSQVEEILAALVSLGLAHRLRGGNYSV